ncbi:uncharacterized protein LOC135167533 [Diachasmimorpha longicaudata]|uniref:uncharacterized protein LOC135167533 n=1 Tax=Diachasmimorpha longicaudata TaxID=58733 RepID=UPI0030B888F9
MTILSATKTPCELNEISYSWELTGKKRSRIQLYSRFTPVPVIPLVTLKLPPPEGNRANRSSGQSRKRGNLLSCCHRSIDVKSSRDVERPFHPSAKMEPKLLLLIVLAGAVEAGEDKEHVHFKIHVPEIIKHHMHTHTIFIHVHHPSKKKKPSHHEHEDFNVYNTYSQHTGYGGVYEAGVDNYAHKDLQQTHYPSLTTYRGHPETTIPYYDDYTSDPGYARNPDAPESDYEDGINAYGYPPLYTTSHYQVNEAVDENPESYERTSYEKSRKSGGEVTQGHLHEKKSQSFYKNNIEESSEKTTKQGSEQNFKIPGIDYLKKHLG